MVLVDQVRQNSVRKDNTCHHGNDQVRQNSVRKAAPVIMEVIM